MERMYPLRPWIAVGVIVVRDGKVLLVQRAKAAGRVEGKDGIPRARPSAELLRLRGLDLSTFVPARVTLDQAWLGAEPAGLVVTAVLERVGQVLLIDPGGLEVVGVLVAASVAH